MPIEILSSLSLYFEVLTLQIQCIRNWSGLSGGTSRIIRNWSRSSELSGRVPPGIRRTDKLSLWRGGHWSAGLGELQGDGIREIWGELSYLPRSRDGEVGQSGSLAFWNEGRNQWMNDAGKAPSGAMNFYASRSTPVVGEIRPVNRAVRYLIRAR